MISMRALLVLALSPVFLASCGAATSPGSGGSQLEQDGGDSDAQGTGGAAGGGTAGSSGSGTAGAGGVPGQGGAAGAGGGIACCLAAAVCNPGDREISGPDGCPAGASCYSNSICCSTVWCVSEAQCEAYPFCDPGDRELDGACPPAYSCYERSLCGSTIMCLDVLVDGGPAPLPDGGACNPQEEYNRNYAGSSPGECALIDFICPANTTYFANDCGCGCEQDSSCPEFVDCMPGPGNPDPLCGTEGAQRCPYTIRAL